MKKSLLLTGASFFLLSLTSSAQIAKGSMLLGGGISGSRSTVENNNQESKYSSFSVYPAIGMAVKENTVVGLRLTYSHSKSGPANNPYTQEQKGYGAGLFYRKYMPLGKQFYLFGEGAAYYGYSEQTNTLPDNTVKQKNRNIGVNFYPGVAFAVSRKIQLEAGLNNLVDLSYNKSNTETTSFGGTSFSSSSGFGFSTNVSTSSPLTVGFRFVLGK